MMNASLINVAAHGYVIVLQSVLQVQCDGL